MSTYAVEPDSKFGYHVIQTMANGDRGRIVSGVISHQSAETWADNQRRVEVDAMVRQKPIEAPS
jgi:hypothetical protein